MVRTMFVLMAAAGLVTIAAAQSTQYVYFSTRFAETPASGRGGHVVDMAAPTHPLALVPGFVNEAAVLNHQGFAVVLPGSPNMTPVIGQPCSPPPCPTPPMVVDFLEIANIPQFDLESGDTNNNGLYNDTTNGTNLGTSANFAGVDSLWIPFAPAHRAANLHECFVSVFADASGTGGYRGTAITEADVFLMPAASNPYAFASTPHAPIFFLRQSDLEVFFGMPAGSGNAVDTDAFAVDQASGDIYISFDGLSASNPNAFTGTFLSAPLTPITAQVHAGDVFRIPGAAYTPSGPYGIVTSPLPNLVERIYTAANVTAMVTAAGGCITNTGSSTTGVLYTNARDVDVDSASPLTATPQGFVVRHLYFVIDNRGTPSAGCPAAVPSNLTAAAIYTTAAGGSFAILNGTVMSSPGAAGMKDLSFNAAFFTGPLDALDIVELAVPYDSTAGAPFHLDNFPNCYFHLNGAAVTPIATGYIAGAAPGTSIAILMRVDLQSSGGFIDRYAHSAFGILTGYPDLYMDIFAFNNGNFLLAPFILSPYGQDPFVQSLFNGGPSYPDWNPIVTYSDQSVFPPTNNGDSAFSLDLTSLIGLVPFPFVLTFQAIDMFQLKLSDAISFEFN